MAKGPRGGKRTKKVGTVAEHQRNQVEQKVVVRIQ